MARTDNDTWDLASSVGVTATAVAAARAVATRQPDPLIDDRFAAPLVRAVGVEVFAKLADGDLSPADLGDEAGQDLQNMIANMAVRTRFFDDFFTDADDAGITQAVILAAGLDSRAYRLAWAAGTTVYEIDQPQVIEFKTTTLADLGAKPTAERRTVAVDLRHDWPAALRAAGFDPARPTAWSAEGLLGYLPPEAQDRLLDNITALSAPGSRLATETADPDPATQERMRQRMAASAEQWRRHGLDLDTAGLIYFGDRNEVAAYLGEHGWRVHGRGLDELLAEHGLAPAGDDTGFAGMRYLVAEHGTAGSEA
ncbi:class I SAM-dependent methyltransferase [Mycolicibacillus trivialis]|uniref:S-adenosyl-L-methionine-dependent methyltransferase n=1 Tax=Mycolicibacillus trivialis TaxID=1798 RepID=A0A1X2EHE8_9MYCO|nr:class I SAM-dependent methyltransferase [Mycolicibacillus trivialis]ORX02151.1 SAM-dependent methyltransferase [Mycolicibacillus trivialis]